jgi:hypothetical protein
MVDELASRGMESYVSNEPQTFYNMAHYLLTTGNISHTISMPGESPADMDRRALIDRACKYIWSTLDMSRQSGGSMPFIDEFSFFLLILGWYSVRYSVTPDGQFNAEVWNPYTVYPRYSNGRMSSLVHAYKESKVSIQSKARQNKWNYTYLPTDTTGDEDVADYYYWDDAGTLYNCILIGGKDVTGVVPRPEAKIIAAPVGGFPDRGALDPNIDNYQRVVGRSIFDVNEKVVLAFNKWKSMMSQSLRDSVQGVTEEFSAVPQATPQQLRERGALFHYSPTDPGLKRVEPIPIPIEVQANLQEIRRELQKGFFSDAVYGMMNTESGYGLERMATSSANQILYPYMDAKHFVLSVGDKFFLSNIKTGKRTLLIKDKSFGELKSNDLPEDINVVVESEVATPKDWLERGTITGMLRDTLDESTIITEILHLSDPQAIIRKKQLDKILNSPMSQLIQQISSYYYYADYLDSRGDVKQAQLFRKAAQQMETQFGQPAPGQASNNSLRTAEQSSKEAGATSESNLAATNVMPQEAQGGFTPGQLRNSLGKGSLRATGK